MIIILNGLLATGKTFLSKKIQEIYTIIDEDEKAVQAALSLHEDILELEKSFCYLQIEKLKKLIAAFKKDPKKPIIYVSSILYTTSIYWHLPLNPEHLEEALCLNREIRGIQHIEQMLLALMGQYYEIRLEPTTETIIKQFQLRQRSNEFCPGRDYVQFLKNREKKVPLLARHTILKSNNISIATFAQITKVSSTKTLSAGFRTMTIEQYENFYPQSHLIALHIELLCNLLQFWDKMSLQDIIGGLLPTLPLTLIKDFKILEKLFISMIKKHSEVLVESVDLLQPYDCKAKFSIDILTFIHQTCVFIFDDFCCIEQTEKLFEELNFLSERDLKLVHVLFEGGAFSGTKVFPTVSVRIKGISDLTECQYDFMNQTWSDKQ